MTRVVVFICLLNIFAIAAAANAQSSPYYSDGLSLNGEASSSARTCQTTLGNNAYDCNVNSSFGTSFADCFQFISPGTHSANFDLYPVGLGVTLGCACDPTGSFKKPKFNASPNAFDCSGDTAPAYDWAGKAAGKKLKGHINSENGDSFVFACTLRSSPCP